MKIYRFSLETGVFQGEDFADEAPLESGKHIIPDDATTVPPPPFERGHAAFFNARDQRWDIRTLEHTGIQSCNENPGDSTFKLDQSDSG